jgi:hypothetical protein
MIVHLERARINLPGALSSPHVAVRRQACLTMTHLLMFKFSSKQQKVFSSLWVAPLTRLLWTDSDSSVVSAASCGLYQMLASAVLKQVKESHFKNILLKSNTKVMVSEFNNVPSSFFVVCDRVRLLMTDTQCAPLLVPLAVVADQSPGLGRRKKQKVFSCIKVCIKL